MIPVLKDLCAYSEVEKLVPIPKNKFYDAFYETCRRVEVRELTSHCCRHTYITRLTRAKIPPAIIQKGARHTSYETTLGYTHMHIDDVLQAVNSLSVIIEKVA